MFRYAKAVMLVSGLIAAPSLSYGLGGETGGGGGTGGNNLSTQVCQALGFEHSHAVNIGFSNECLIVNGIEHINANDDKKLSQLTNRCALGCSNAEQ